MTDARGRRLNGHLAHVVGSSDQEWIAFNMFAFMFSKHLNRTTSTATTSGARSASISGLVVGARIVAVLTDRLIETGDGYLAAFDRLIHTASTQSNGEAMNFNNFDNGKPDCSRGNEQCAFVY